MEKSDISSEVVREFIELEIDWAPNYSRYIHHTFIGDYIVILYLCGGLATNKDSIWSLRVNDFIEQYLKKHSRAIAKQTHELKKLARLL